MRDHKNEDRDYLKQFEDKSVEELLEILSTEAKILKEMIKDILTKGNTDGKE